MKKYKKIIGIDARLYGSHGRGLGRYLKEVIDRMISSHNDYRFVVFLSIENFESFKIKKDNVEKVLIRARWYSFVEQIVMPFFIWRKKVDLMYFAHFNVPYFCPSNFIVTIHDLILFHFPSQRASKLAPGVYKIKEIIYHKIIRRAVFKSEKVITVSNFSKQDILDNFPVQAEKIKRIYEGVYAIPGDEKNLQHETLKEYGIKKNFVMCVGSAYPHKNLEFLVDEFSQMRRVDLQLLVIGQNDYFMSRLRDYVSVKGYKNIVFTGFVSDVFLSFLYGKALFYIFPSKYEGFGLPALEAQAYNCPVLSSRVASLPEILGDSALYFQLDNGDDFKNKFNRMMDDSGLRESLLISGKKNLERFSWDDCAKNIWSVLGRCL